MSNIREVFVYGSLKQGYLRGGQWPRKPLRIQPAVIQAKLYDVGPYPAIGGGEDWILGELWSIHEDDMQITLEVLDQIEGYDALGEDNQYIRIPVTATLENGDAVTAYVYQFASTERLTSLRVIQPFKMFGGKRCAAWPDLNARVPASFADE